ncbi:hypothetical protein EJB05_14556 [Eragrostis curvula]|uniref:Uncharacterized protein n=1 Tax=Eragrostis curvula TaxID=38414 RepID=A0A5J9VZI7_9POAL|nr:hypothetical protein EJB05_14556 [Eragrostis curvula]
MLQMDDKSLFTLPDVILTNINNYKRREFGFIYSSHLGERVFSTPITRRVHTCTSRYHQGPVGLTLDSRNRASASLEQIFISRPPPPNRPHPLPSPSPKTPRLRSLSSRADADADAMAALAIARKSTCSILARAKLSGRGLWHAPLPSRYRFAVHAAGSRFPPLFPTQSGGGRWTAPAWEWAAFTSLSGGNTASAREGGLEAIAKALLDIRGFAGRAEAHSKQLDELTTILASEQRDLIELVKQLRASSQRSWAKTGFVALVFSAVVYVLFYVGAEYGLETLDLFLSTRVKQFVRDPELQKAIKDAAISFSDTAARRINPFHRVKAFIWGSEDEAEIIPSLDVSRKTCIALLIMVLLADAHSGATTAELIEQLSKVGMNEEEIRNMLDLLLKMRYVETCETYNPRRGLATSYWPSMSGVRDSASGKLEKRLKKKPGRPKSKHNCTCFIAVQGPLMKHSLGWGPGWSNFPSFWFHQFKELLVTQ